MNSASLLIHTFQTASPVELATLLGVEIEWTELPTQVGGLYCPVGDKGIIVLNRSRPSVRQRFLCGYHLGVHLLKQKLSINTLTLPERYNPSAIVFATDLLTEYGEYGSNVTSKTIQRYYQQNGVPTAVTLEAQGMYDKLAKYNRRWGKR